MTYSSLPPAHGGELKNLYASKDRIAELKQEARDLPTWDLTPRQLCDIELLLNGGFSPLDGFLGERDYQRVCTEMRLENGLLWPIPVTLDVSEAFAQKVNPGDRLALVCPEGVPIAIMSISDKWIPDRLAEAMAVFGTSDVLHPGVDYLLNRSNPMYLGGRLEGIEAPTHYDFRHLRDSPAELREKFEKWGWRRIVAYQTRNPMHRAHQELTFRAAQKAEANLLIHPVVGMSMPGDIDHYTRVRCYEKILDCYPAQTTGLSLLGLAMRMGGPREALWHAIIQKNYGCTHFIVGHDHADPGKHKAGGNFYGTNDAQEMVARHEDELGIESVASQRMVYVEERAQYHPIDQVDPSENILNISDREFSRRLREGVEIPEWFSYPAVVQELRRAYPARDKQGFVIFFTGLSGSGKSTIANALGVKLMEIGGRSVTLLDGDIVRKNLSSELGFSREHRDLNILRIGFVAAEIAKAGGVAICAPIAPYATTRKKVREMVEKHGGFIEAHISTPIEVCESRDRKGLYAKARAGVIKEFTGISDPYEIPDSPELRIDTQTVASDEAAQRILLKIESLGYIK